MNVMTHTGGRKLLDDTATIGEALRVLRPDVAAHVNGGPTPPPVEDIDWLVEETTCALTSYQFALLRELARHAGRVMSREALMDLLRNEKMESFDRSIDVHVSRIRAAIEDDPRKPRRVITVRGTGYVFAKAQE